MKDLKQKYKAYKTPFDESAFEHFQTIQQKGTTGQKVKSWHIMVVIFLLSIPAAFYISSLISSKNTNTQDVSLASKQEKKQDAAPKTFDKNKASKYDNKTNTKEEISIVNNDILNEKITNTFTPKALKIQKETKRTPIITTRNIVNDAHNYLPSTNQHLAPPNIDKTDITPPQNPIITPPKNIDISQPENNIQKIQIEKLFEPQAIPLKTPLLKHDDAQNFELSPILSPVPPPTPAKTWGHYRNHLKLSYHYINLYRGNTPLGLIPGYKTPSYLIQGEYFRELNKIISLGGSTGFTRIVDPDTQVRDSLSYHNITFAHLNLYFFLVNSKKHQLYFKAGSGITHTKMQVLSSTWTPPDIITPVLRRQNKTNPGLSLELSYSYHFKEHWFASVNAGRLWYTFGSEYLGVSLGYTF